MQMRLCLHYQALLHSPYDQTPIQCSLHLPTDKMYLSYHAMQILQYCIAHTLW